MSQTPILPLIREATQDFSSHVHADFWLLNSPQQPKHQVPAALVEKLLAEGGRPETVCLISPRLDGAGTRLIATLLEWANGGTRIYILTGIEPSAKRELAGAALMRYGFEAEGSLLLLNPQKEGSNGHFLSHPISDTEETHLLHFALDERQCEEAYRYFTSAFWGQAKFEILTRDASPQPVGEAPFTIIPPTDLLPILAKSIQSGNLISYTGTTTRFDLSGAQGATIVCEAGLSQPSTLGRHNNLYAHAQAPVLQSARTKDGVFVLLKAGGHRFALPLNKVQTKALEVVVEGLREGSDREFVPSSARDALVGKRIQTLGANEETQIQASATYSKEKELQELINLPAMQALALDCPDDGRSVRVTYQWKLIPLRLPGSAKPDGLYAEWEKEDKKWHERLKKVGEDLRRQIEDREKTSALQIAKKLLGFFKRQGSEHESIQEALQELGSGSPSAMSEEGRTKAMQKVWALERKVKELADESKVRKANAEQEQKREEEIAKAKAAIRSAEDLVASQQQNLQSGGQRLDQELLEREEAWRKFLELHGKAEEMVTNWRKELEAKAKKDQPAAQTLKELIAMDANPKRKQVKTDKELLERKLKDAQSGLETAKRQLQRAEALSSTASHATQGGTLHHLEDDAPPIPASQQEFPKPQFPESLPKVGVLHHALGKRHLAISHWEDYDQAQQEAKRLNAILCAKNPSTTTP